MFFSFESACKPNWNRAAKVVHAYEDERSKVDYKLYIEAWLSIASAFACIPFYWLSKMVLMPRKIPILQELISYEYACFRYLLQSLIKEQLIEQESDENTKLGGYVIGDETLEKQALLHEIALKITGL